MNNLGKFSKDFSLSKGKVLKTGNNISLDVKGDFTKINLGELDREYKLRDAYTKIRNLEFRSEKEIRLQTFSDYFRKYREFLELKFYVERKPRPKYPIDESYRDQKHWFLYYRGDLLVMVESSIYNAVKDKIKQYVLDVGRDGYWATIHVVHGGKPADIRSYIKIRNPVGVLLVGSIAAPWFELDNDFHDVHSEFPCDLYYMDTNGTWNDPDGDGKFNNHNDNLDPEIWVGRIWTPTADGNDTDLINNYFARNHAFRLGQLGHANSALAYVDDDWKDYGNCALDEQFPASNITVFTTPIVTDSDLYKAEVNKMRSWVQLCAHSSPHSHEFTVADTKEYIYYTYFKDTNPPNAHFYNLFCCGPGNYTSPNYLGGWYIFDKSGGGKNLGLTAIASSKSGSMLLFEDFYRSLGAGKCIGDAFVDWWRARGPSHDLGERRWFYGLVLLGDPTLTWWKGAVPRLVQPQAEDIFDHWPRKMQFKWDPVDVPGAKYDVEVDAKHAIVSGKWAEEINQTFLIYNNVPETFREHTFVGAQRGRWRVRAKISGRECSWSPWSYFQFSV